MNSLEEKKNNIIELEDEIRELNEKKNQLLELKKEYYNEYFNTKRNEYEKITDYPDNPTKDKHILYNYSILNVDTIGKIICDLISRYDNKIFVSKRMGENDIRETAFGYENISYPILVIKDEKDIQSEYDNSFSYNRDIIIKYDSFKDLKKYPTSKPVEWDFKYFTGPKISSNYNNLIDYNDGLSFDYKEYKYIKDLIYSLSYYQKEHNMKTMNPNDTWNVYKKIFKK